MSCTVNERRADGIRSTVQSNIIPHGTVQLACSAGFQSSRSAPEVIIADEGRRGEDSIIVRHRARCRNALVTDMSVALSSVVAGDGTRPPGEASLRGSSDTIADGYWLLRA